MAPSVSLAGTGARVSAYTANPSQKRPARAYLPILTSIGKRLFVETPRNLRIWSRLGCAGGAGQIQVSRAATPMGLRCASGSAVS